jgi:hypothetical protein
MPSRVDSRRKLGSEVRIRRVNFGIWNSSCLLPLCVYCLTEIDRQQPETPTRRTHGSIYFQ